MMKKTEEINCIVCQSDDYEILYKEGRDNIPINFSICRNCGLTYLNPRWTKEAYNSYYSTEYDGDYRAEELDHSSNSLKFNSVTQILDRLKREKILDVSPKNVLDIGSGMGWSSIYLKENIYPEANYAAIEPSVHCQENLKKNGIEILTADVDSNWSEGIKGKFDLIIMRHVLEHFMNPVDVLKKVREVLSDDGVVYIAVPNAENPKVPIQKTYFRVVHTYYFGKYSFLNVLKLSGLETSKVSTLDTENPYELFAFCSKSDFDSPEINPVEYGRYSSFLYKRLKRDSSIVGVILYKLRKIFS